MRRSFGAILSCTLCAAAATGQTAPAQPPAPFDRPVSFKLLPSNLLSDQKRIWLAPLRLAHPKNRIAPAAIVGVTAL